MPIAVQCPECSSRLNAPDAAAGKTLSCPKCNAALHVPASAPAFEVVDEVPPAPPRHPAAAFPAAILVDDDEDDDEVPRGKGRKKGPGKSKSRGPLVAAVAAVLLVGGFAAYWFGFRTKEADSPAVATGRPATSGTNTAPLLVQSPVGGMVGEAGGPTEGFQASFPWGRPTRGDYEDGRSFDRRQLSQRVPAVQNATRYSAKRGASDPTGGYDFTIVRIRYRPDSTPATRQQALDEAVKGLYMWTGLKAGPTTAVTWAGQAASEIIYTGEPGPDGVQRQTVLRYFNTDTLGFLGIIRDSGGVRPQEIASFFQGFQYLGPPKSAAPPPVKPPDVVAMKPVEVPADWPRADFAQGTFRVAFPTAPSAEEQLDKILKSCKITHDIQAATVGGAMYQAGSFQYPDGASDEEKEQMRIQVATAVGIANPPPRHVNLTRQGVKWAEYRRRTTPAGKVIAYVRFHEVDSTVHVLAARGLDLMTPPAEWERFTASYELRKP